MSGPFPHHLHVHEALVADNIGIAAVPPIPDDRCGAPYHGRPGLLFQFMLGGRNYQPILFVGLDLARLPTTLAAALADLPSDAPPVRCPGCSVVLHGPVAERGACLGCFPAVPS